MSCSSTGDLFTSASCLLRHSPPLRRAKSIEEQFMVLNKLALYTCEAQASDTLINVVRFRDILWSTESQLIDSHMPMHETGVKNSKYNLAISP